MKSCATCTWASTVSGATADPCRLPGLARPSPPGFGARPGVLSSVTKPAREPMWIRVERQARYAMAGIRLFLVYLAPVGNAWHDSGTRPPVAALRSNGIVTPQRALADGGSNGKASWLRP